jgi:hypothetical protein
MGADRVWFGRGLESGRRGLRDRPRRQQGAAIDVECTVRAASWRSDDLLAASNHAQDRRFCGARARLRRLAVPKARRARPDARLAAGVIAENDVVPVVKKTREMALGVVVDAAAHHVETGERPGRTGLSRPSARTARATTGQHSRARRGAIDVRGIVLDDPPA